MIKGKRLLILGAGNEQLPAYLDARLMGLKIVGLDRDPNAPGFNFADDQIIASTYDVEESLREVIKYCKNKKVDGVITLASDIPLTVASICEELGLPGISKKTAELTSNKLVQYNHLKKSGINLPATKEIKTPEELNQVIQKWGWPLVIKPLDNRGSRGVLRLIKGIDPKKSFFESVKFSGTNSVIVQKYIEGSQISSETFVKNGKCYTAMLSGRNYSRLDEFAPYIIEDGGHLPAMLKDNVVKKVEDVIQKAANSLGIYNGHIKGDLVISNNEVIVLEFASRMGGGYAVSHSIPKVTGINLVYQHILMALGENVNEKNLLPHIKGGAVLRFIFSKPGIVKNIVDNNTPDDNILIKKIYVSPGDKIFDITDHTKRIGVVLGFGQTIQEAESVVIENIRKIEIELEH